MTNLDHVIIRVTNASISVKFYVDIVGFSHDGRTPPFDIIRVSDTLTLDLLLESPKDPIHLAFSFNKYTFDDLHHRLLSNNVPFGSGVFERNGLIDENSDGACGRAKAFYFYDPDGHNLEARLYD